MEIDKSLFRHKPKASSSSAISITYVAKLLLVYTASPWATPTPTDMGVWDGGYASVCPGLGYMEVVTARDARTLLPIIQAHTAPGTTIHSDEWRACSSVSTIPAVAQHGVINHSLHFIDPVTGVQLLEQGKNKVEVDEGM